MSHGGTPESRGCPVLASSRHIGRLRCRWRSLVLCRRTGPEKIGSSDETTSYHMPHTDSHKIYRPNSRGIAGVDRKNANDEFYPYTKGNTKN